MLRSLLRSRSCLLLLNQLLALKPRNPKDERSIASCPKKFFASHHQSQVPQSEPSGQAAILLLDG